MDNTGYLLMSVSKKLRYKLNYALHPLDITVQQWAVIQQLSHYDNAKLMTANELAKILDMDKPTISAIIKRLENKKLIYKRKNKADSRAFDLFLSQEGMDVYTKAVKISNQILEEFTAKLSQNESERLNQILQKLDSEEVV